MNFNSLRKHAGHHLEVIEHGNKKQGVVRLTLECVECGEILASYQKPKGSKKRAEIRTSGFMVECPDCLRSSSIEAWNAETSACFDEPGMPSGIIPLEEECFDSNGEMADKEAVSCSFCCPRCHHEVCGTDLKEGC